MRRILTFFIILFVAPTVFAKGKLCRIVFEKETIRNHDNPRVYLASLGLKEGTDAFGNKDESIEIVKAYHSYQSRFLKEFTDVWPDIKIHYLVEAPYSTGQFPVRIRALVRQGKDVVALRIPLATLKDPTALIAHLAQINLSLQKIEILKRENVDYLLDALTSEAFTLQIDKIPQQTRDPYLKILRGRMEKHGTKFSFTDSALSPHFQNVSGLAVGNFIEISSQLFLDSSAMARSTLAHELTHVSTHLRFEARGDVSRSIWFRAGGLNKNGLTDLDVYKRSFQTDEVEAWYITEKMEGTPLEQSRVPSFLYNQLYWLQLLRYELPRHLEKVQKEEDFLKAQNRHLGHRAMTMIEKKESRNFEFRLFENTADEVVVLIPRVPEKIKNLGALKFLEEVIDRRLRQLEHRAHVIQQWAQ
jgi:hypothetical protein